MATLTFTGLYEWESPYTHEGRRIAWRLDCRDVEGLCELRELREKPDGSFKPIMHIVMSWEAAQAFADAVNRHRPG